MISRCYSIYDRKTLVYWPPFYQATNGAAVRTFSDLVADPNGNVGKHPNDYVLYCVGTYDDAKGYLMPMSPLEHVIDANALLQSLQSEIPFPASLTERGSADPRPSNGEAR